MTDVIKALDIAIQISKMDIGQLLMARQATDNPRLHAILDKAIDAKLPKNKQVTP